MSARLNTRSLDRKITAALRRGWKPGLGSVGSFARRGRKRGPSQGKAVANA